MPQVWDKKKGAKNLNQQLLGIGKKKTEWMPMTLELGASWSIL